MDKIVVIPLLFLAASCATVPRPQNQASSECAKQIAAELYLPTAPLDPSGERAVVAPQVIVRVEPEPPAEMALGRPRSATVEAVIRADGSVGTVCVRSGDPQWGQIVQEAVRRWTFRPGTLAGEPVATLFSMTATMR
ncbi:MAG TPA: hypothetical protein VF883_10390 [Thermoanaerobaculia bacterium]|jgi:hypothetical protein